jgi:hypothetical protein
MRKIPNLKKKRKEKNPISKKKKIKTRKKSYTV